MSPFLKAVASLCAMVLVSFSIVETEWAVRFFDLGCALAAMVLVFSARNGE